MEAIREAKRPEPTRQIAFLLGSGFSRTDGLPLPDDINGRLANLQADEFYLTQDLRAGFYLDDHSGKNDWMSAKERLFAQEFTRFYIETKLDGQMASFNYEKFFDYVKNVG